MLIKCILSFFFPFRGYDFGVISKKSLAWDHEFLFVFFPTVLASRGMVRFVCGMG